VVSVQVGSSVLIECSGVSGCKKKGAVLARKQLNPAVRQVKAINTMWDHITEVLTAVAGLESTEFGKDRRQDGAAHY
jgi:hypothetical protein